jgi:hypothetical protein
VRMVLVVWTGLVVVPLFSSISFEEFLFYHYFLDHALLCCGMVVSCLVGTVFIRQGLLRPYEASVTGSYDLGP